MPPSSVRGPLDSRCLWAFGGLLLLNIAVMVHNMASPSGKLSHLRRDLPLKDALAPMSSSCDRLDVSVTDLSALGEWKDTSASTGRVRFADFMQDAAYEDCAAFERQGSCLLARADSSFTWHGSTPNMQVFNGTPSEAAMCLRNSRIVFAGDSLMRQQSRFFRCMLEVMHIQDVDVEFHECPYLVHKVQSGRTFIESSADLDASRLCDALEASLDPAQAKPPDAIVFNAGRWIGNGNLGIDALHTSSLEWRKVAETIYRGAARRLRAKATALRNSTGKSLSLIFRSTSPKFFRGERDWYNEGYCHCKSDTSPFCREGTFQPTPMTLKGTTFEEEFPEMNILAHREMCQPDAEYPIDWLDVTLLSMAREDVTADCTHFCRKGVVEVWNMILLNRLCRGRF